MLLAFVVICLIAASSAPGGEATKAPALEPQVFEDFDETEVRPTAAVLRQTLTRVPGERLEIADAKKHERTYRRMSGLARLNLPWPADSALRISILDPERFQLHVWNGARGVTLRYYPEFQQAWAGFGTTREGNKPRPTTSILLATSDDRYRRGGTGTVELHYRDGNLALVRGDLLLLSVPLAGAPAEVYLEGTGLVRGLDIIPSKWTPEPVQKGPSVLKSFNPAELTWEKVTQKGFTLSKLADGRVELSADEKAPLGQTAFPLGGSGLYDVLFEIEDASPGTGVFLGSAEGQHLCRVGFLRDRETGRTTFELMPVWSGEIDKSYDANKLPVPWAAPRQWFRLVCGAGMARCFMSSDGVHWSQPAPAAYGYDGACAKVGLYCVAGEKKRAIKLRALEVRRLDAILSAAPEAIVRRTDASLIKSESLEAWQEKVLKSRPGDVDQETWWRACAVRTLVDGSRTGIARALFDRLVSILLDQGGEADSLLRLAEQRAILCSDEWNAIEVLMARADQLGAALARQGHPSPFMAVSRAMLRWPFWHGRRLPVFSEPLLRQELTVRIRENRWDDVRTLCQWVRYWNTTGGPREGEQPPWSPHAEYLIDWADSLADRTLPKRNEQKPTTRFTTNTTDPLLENVGREALNTMGEIRAALEGQSYREACQAINAVPGAERIGLVPDGKDSRLLVSFPVAIESALLERPALRKAMEEQYGRIARLRLSQASAAGDAAAMTAVAMQFAGTETAGEAHRWLGDRALAAGNFREAIRHYRQAQSLATTTEREPIGARVRLAGALMGLDLGQPVKSAVQFGKTRYTPGDFEKMTAQLREARKDPSAATQSSPVLTPGRYEPRPFARIEGRDVKRPPEFPDRGLDWVGRLTGTLFTKQEMIVNNRIEQAAFALDGGRQLWSQKLAVQDNRIRWPLTAMTPAMIGNRVFMRRLANDGPELACFNLADGKILWQCRPDDGMASDPLVLDDKLFALSVVFDSASKISVNLVAVSPDSGRVRARTLLAEFRDLWQKRLPCQAAVIDDRIVATVGGCVVCCDTSGRVRWLRRQVWVPAAAYEYYIGRPWIDPVHRVPLAGDGCIYATQPGVWEIECIDLESGRIRWRQSLGGLLQIVGRASDRLVVQTNDDLLGLDAATGKVLWSREVKDCGEVSLCGPPDTVLYARSMPKKDKKPAHVVLAWLDAKTGRGLGHCELKMPQDAESWFHQPILAGKGRQWACVATLKEPAKREIMELVRTGDLASEDLAIELGQ